MRRGTLPVSVYDSTVMREAPDAAGHLLAATTPHYIAVLVEADPAAMLGWGRSVRRSSTVGFGAVLGQGPQRRFREHPPTETGTRRRSES